MQNRFFSVSLWVSLAVLAALSGLVADWPINQWSVAYLGQRPSPQSATAALSAPPEHHPHANIWLAEDALRQDDSIRAYALTKTLADQGDKNALIIAGDALEISLNEWISRTYTWIKEQVTAQFSQFEDIASKLAHSKVLN